jgi:hypothetical protein
MTQDLKAPSVGMLVGARVRTFRMFKGWTQTQLGEHALVEVQPSQDSDRKSCEVSR